MIRVLLEASDGSVACGPSILHISEGWRANVDTDRKWALVFTEDLSEFFADKPRSGTSVPVTIVVIKDGRQSHINGVVDGIYFTSEKEGEEAVETRFRMRLADGSLADVTLNFRDDTFTARHGTNRQMKSLNLGD